MGRENAQERIPRNFQPCWLGNGGEARKGEQGGTVREQWWEEENYENEVPEKVGEGFEKERVTICVKYNKMSVYLMYQPGGHW